ncbi:MAG: hypothetical protein AVDCRST_MAG10-2569, partial [uncultured Acidimicrobiales bacterium]
WARGRRPAWPAPSRCRARTARRCRPRPRRTPTRSWRT